MLLSSFQVLLLAVVAITSAPRSALGQAAPAICTAADVGKQFCSSCNTTSKCGTADVAPVPLSSCKAGQACKVLLEKYAVCKPIAETPCACGGKTAKCDPYDPHSRIICLSGNITANEKCIAPTDTCINDKCGTAPPQPTTVSPGTLCLTAETGLVAVTPECTIAVFCDATESIGTTAPCGAGQYYDVDELECLPAPPPPCPVACGTGACNDKGNCSKWNICDVGTVLSEEICEDPTPEFDTITAVCVVKGNATCSKNNGCNFNLITTSATTQPLSSSTTSSTSSTKTISTPSTTSTSTKSTITSSTTSTKTSTTPPTSPSMSSSSSSTTSTSSTTNRPSTCGAANAGIRYPVAGNCKKYTSCRLVSTNVYGYVESSCLGLLVFNAKTSYCDTLANVPGCVPPS